MNQINIKLVSNSFSKETRKKKEFNKRYYTLYHTLFYYNKLIKRIKSLFPIDKF